MSGPAKTCEQTSYRYEATARALRDDVFAQATVGVLGDLFRAHGMALPRIVDVGCGVGRLHSLLAPLALRIAGCEPSGPSLAMARGENPSIEYRVREGWSIPYPTGAFDVGLAVCALGRMPAEGRALALADMRRVVRRGGLVVIVDHNPWHPAGRLSASQPQDGERATMAAAQARRALAAAGLSSVSARHFVALPYEASWIPTVEKVLGSMPLGAYYAAWGTV